MPMSHSTSITMVPVAVLGPAEDTSVSSERCRRKDALLLKLSTTMRRCVVSYEEKVTVFLKRISKEIKPPCSADVTPRMSNFVMSEDIEMILDNVDEDNINARMQNSTARDTNTAVDLQDEHNNYIDVEVQNLTTSSNYSRMTLENEGEDITMATMLDSGTQCDVQRNLCDFSYKENIASNKDNKDKKIVSASSQHSTGTSILQRKHKKVCCKFFNDNMKKIDDGIPVKPVSLHRLLVSRRHHQLMMPLLKPVYQSCQLHSLNWITINICLSSIFVAPSSCLQSCLESHGIKWNYARICDDEK